jgi:hypothetical protein
MIMTKLNELRDESRMTIEQFLVKAVAGLATVTLTVFLSAGCELDLGENGGDDKSEDQTAETTDATDATGADTTAAEEEEEEADAPVVDANGCTTLSTSDGGGGFVSNPENSRGTLKLIFPGSYNETIGSVNAYTADGRFSDEFHRVTPNEEGDRPRYYGTKDIGEYPANLIVVAEISDGSCRTFTLANPQQRYD